MHSNKLMQIDGINKQNRLLSFDSRCPVASFDLLFLQVRETWVIVASGPQLAGSLITMPSCIWLSHASERCSQAPCVCDLEACSALLSMDLGRSLHFCLLTGSRGSLAQAVTLARSCSADGSVSRCGCCIVTFMMGGRRWLF